MNIFQLIPDPYLANIPPFGERICVSIFQTTTLREAAEMLRDRRGDK